MKIAVSYTVLIWVSCVCEALEPTQKPLIRFNTDGKLKITMFTDLHYGGLTDKYFNPGDDVKSTSLIANILEWEKPDFVIFTGDQITGDHTLSNGTEYIHMLLAPLVKLKYRWASVYGNHDIGEHITRKEILEVEQSYGDLCYTQQVSTDLPGVTNYFIPVYSSMETNNSIVKNEKPVMIWWFFDSQGGADQFGPQPNYIDPSVIQWFKNESSKLQAQWKELIPSLVFFHTPPMEFLQIHEEVLNNALCTGLLDDDVSPQNRSEIMDVLLQIGGVKTIFVGHDHGNAWCCLYKGIKVCYNRASGFGGYGTWLRGARVIGLDLNNLNKQTNYVRVQTGEIVDSFTP